MVELGESILLVNYRWGLFMRERVEFGGMVRESKSPIAKILVMLAIALLPPLAYMGGYFWGQKLATGNIGQPLRYVRCYRYRWQEAIFLPAAKAESFLSGSETTSSA